MLSFILITFILLKLVQGLDISSYFSSSTPKASKASKESNEQNKIRDALKASDSEVAVTPLVLMETVGDENVSEKETNKATTLVETLGR